MEPKKRGLLAYTPVGAVVKFGSDQLKSALQKVSFTAMAFQAELQDSVTGEPLVALVSARGTGALSPDKPIDFAAYRKDLNEWGERLACQLSNARAPGDQRINCRDPAARARQAGNRP